MVANATLGPVPRLLLDVTRLAYRRVTATLPTGIDRVGLEYVRHYGARARAVLSLGPFSALLAPADSAALFAALLDPAASARGLALWLAAKSILWRWIASPARGDVLVNTSHTGLENAHYGATLRARGVRTLVMVHDLIPLTHPQFCRTREPALHRTRMRCAAGASAVVANSSHTLEEFEAFCRGQGLAVPCSRVARLGAGLPQLQPGPPPLAAPYFVVLGTIEPRKNHAMLLRLWQRLAVALGDRAPRLVVIGQRGWMCEEVCAQLAAGSNPAVTWIERCADGELATWLAHASALLFPSFAEGYGLPAVEAAALGVPLIASDLPVLREILGDIPDYAAPEDEERWQLLVAEHTDTAGARRRAQMGRLRDFEPSTWAQHFAIVSALIAELRDARASGAPVEDATPEAP